MLRDVRTIHKGDTIIREGKHLKVTGRRLFAGKDAHQFGGVPCIEFTTEAGSMITAAEGQLEVAE